MWYLIVINYTSHQFFLRKAQSSDPNIVSSRLPKSFSEDGEQCTCMAPKIGTTVSRLWLSQGYCWQGDTTIEAGRGIWRAYILQEEMIISHNCVALPPGYCQACQKTVEATGSRNISFVLAGHQRNHRTTKFPKCEMILMLTSLAH